MLEESPNIPTAKTGKKLAFEELTHAIIGAFYAVYNTIGYGFLESVYRNALVIELRRRGMRVEQEVPVEVFYLGERVGFYRIDLIVEGKILLSSLQSSAGERSRQLHPFLLLILPFPCNRMRSV